jgi:hypothetical protein
MTDIPQPNVRQLSTEFYDRGDYTGWFEALYDRADGNFDAIPWADRGVNPWLVEWLQQHQALDNNRSCLVVGCRGRNPEDTCENLPFPLTRSELTAFESTGLTEIGFEDFIDTTTESTPARRFRVTYQR